MSAKTVDDEALRDEGEPVGAEPEADGGEEARPPLELNVTVDKQSACERHVTVTIPREDIERYCDEAYSEMMPSATVPGFRPGRAPRKLVEHRFRKEVLDQVKGSLLMDSITQITEEQSFTAIGEPEFDLEAVEIPPEGPMTFEFDLEVRPDFDLPQWKGLVVERPVREFTQEDVDRRLRTILGRYGQLVPCSRSAKPGDFLSLKITATHGDEVVQETDEIVVRMAPVLSLQDGNIEAFDQLMDGVRPGDVRETDMKLSPGAANEKLRGETVHLRFEVLEVKELKFPELNREFLHEMGEFESVDELRDAIREDFKRQLAYYQGQEVRRQISAALTAAADWDLPPGLLRRQSARELERMVLELRRSGFGEDEIRTRENELRQNSQTATARALKEHFILERIAEEEKVDASSEDFDAEISLIALQSGESPRRIRARLEKRGLMDVLRNQIIERKVIEMVRAQAQLKDRPYRDEARDVEAIDVSAGGEAPPEEEAPQPASKEAGKLQTTPEGAAADQGG